MKKHFLFSFIIALMTLRSVAQTFVPMPCTGYNIDGVAENTTAVSTTGGPLDASDFVLYSQYYGTFYAGAAGLPNNGLMAAGTRTYQLAAYTTSNVLHLFANAADTLVFTNPHAFPSISLLCFGTQGNATASVTVRFSDNSTTVFNSLTMTDWFSITPAIFSGFDRCPRTSGVPALVGGAGNPRMMNIDLPIPCASQGKTISKIIVRNTSASAHLCIMAVSGQIPAYDVSGNTLICSNGTSTLNASGFASYTWQPAGNFAGSNNPTITVNPTGNTVYTLTGTDGTGCPGYTTIAVTVSSVAPVLSLAGSTQSICLGAAATITASGALSYTLSSPAPNGGSFVPVATSVYTVFGTNGCGTASLTTTVTVTPLSISASASNTLVCSGSTTSLSASGAASYTWMPGSSSQTVYAVSPAANTIYTLSGKTSSCNATTTIAIATNPLPTLSIVPTSSDICLGESTTLTVNGNAVTYTWTPGNSTATSINVTPPATTLYVVSATNSFNCIGTAQQAIIVKNTPTITLAANKYSVCPNGSTTLTAGGAVTYTWSTGSNNNPVVVNPQPGQTFTASGSLANGCSSSTVIQIAVMSPSISVNGNAAICNGRSVLISASGASSYTWQPNNLSFPSFSVNPSATTIYTVYGTVSYTQAGLLCPANNTLMVTVYNTPGITASSTRTSICKGEKTVLTASANVSGVNYVWTINSSTLAGSNATVNPSTQTQYNVTGTDANGCDNTTQITVKVNACTGISVEIQNASLFEVFPNPAKAAVNIRSQGGGTIVVINSLGQNIRTVELNSLNAYAAKIEGLAPGLYFVSYANEAGAYTQRLIIE